LANLKSQVKRNKQNEKRRERNIAIKSSIRTSAKKVVKAVDEKTAADALKKTYLSFVRTIDKAASSGIVHKKTAARKKSRLAKRVNTLLKSQS
jgi:small subunit ribosomal protein S20